MPLKPARKKKDILFFANGIDDLHSWKALDGFGELPNPIFITKYKKRIEEIPTKKRT